MPNKPLGVKMNWKCKGTTTQWNSKSNLQWNPCRETNAVRHKIAVKQEESEENLQWTKVALALALAAALKDGQKFHEINAQVVKMRA